MSEINEKSTLPKPPATRDAGTANFFDGTAEGKLMLQYCETCGKYSLTGGRYCPHCLAPVEWKPASGRGSIHTWAVNYQLVHPAFAPDIPYLYGTIELEEGPMLVTRLVDIKQEELSIGFPVNVRFISNDGGEAIPVFGSGRK